MHELKQKEWWTPVWKGLITDPEAKHYRRMKNAVWLYVYFLLNADRRTGVLSRKVATISQDMGLSSDTITRWMGILRKGGYVAARSNGRCLVIEVNKWRGIAGTGNTRDQKPDISKTRPLGFPRTLATFKSRFRARLSPNMHSPPHPIKR